LSFSSERLSEFHQLVSWLVSQGAGHCQPYVNPRITLVLGLAAALFSIFATLSMWKLNPRKWLTWYFEHCAAAGGKVPENIQLFLPWNLSEEKKKELGNAGLPQGDDTS